MFNFLFDTKQSKILYILKTYALNAVVVFPLLYIAYHVFIPTDVPQDTFESNSISIILITPAVETLLMVPILAILRLFGLSVIVTSVLNAIIWSLFHSLFYIWNGFGVLFLFFLLSVAYLTWREESLKSALVVVFSIHAINNAVLCVI